MKKFMLLAVLVFGFHAAAHSQVVESPYGHKIMVFGGSDNKTYLGCLSCSRYDSDSVLNSYGEYGNPSFNTQSIGNSFGDFGGTFSSYSPCNNFASHPPVVVDETGGFYGYLTVDTFFNKRVNVASLDVWLTQRCK